MFRLTLKQLVQKSLLAAALLGGASSLIAVTAASQGKSSKPAYAILDMQSVILSVEEGRSARASLEKEFEQKKTEVKKNFEELEKMRKEWESKQALLSDQAKMKMQNEFQQKFVQLRTKEMKYDQEMKKKEQEATQKIAVKVAKIVQGYAKEKGLDAVFEANTSGMLYVRDPINITSVIIEKYGKTHGSDKTAKKVEKKK
jgi:outer membrane protein